MGINLSNQGIELDKKTGKGGWLIFVAVCGIVAWPLPAILGLLWSRRLRPLNFPGKVGYGLCWLSVTFIPFLALYFVTFKSSLFDRGWQLALYSTALFIWFIAIRLFIPSPSSSIKRAVFVAAVGALLIGPSEVFVGQAAMCLPFGAILVLSIAGWVASGIVPDISSLILIFTLPILVFFAHLIVQWPERSAK